MKILSVELEHVRGGLRASAGSRADLIPLLQQTKDALGDLSRAQTPANDSMMPIMMMMMMKRR